MNPNRYRKYVRKGLAEMKPWTPGMNVFGVSISKADLDAGSPKEGDMIARNPDDPQDRWLVAAEYFNKHFERVGDYVPLGLVEGSGELTVRQAKIISDVLPQRGEWRVLMYQKRDE